jgi:hypothetical protein
VTNGLSSGIATWRTSAWTIGAQSPVTAEGRP